MNNDFEQFLAKQPLRPIPPEWRGQILQAAQTISLQPAQNPEPCIPWWRALIWPSPVAWASVAFVWLLIIGMNIASQPSASETVVASASASSLDISTMIIQERQLVQEFFQPEEEPAEPAEPPRKPGLPGAYNQRRAQHQTEIA